MRKIFIAFAIIAASSSLAIAQSTSNQNTEIHLTVKELQDIIAAQVATAEAQKAQAVAQVAMQKIKAQLAPPKHVAAPNPNVAPSKGK